MTIKKYKPGYTTFEAMIVTALIGVVVGFGFVVYVLIHFLSKVW